MRTDYIYSCGMCGKETNHYDPLVGKVCPSCFWDAIYGFKLNLKGAELNRRFPYIYGIRIEDDGSCVLGKNKEEFLQKEPFIVTHKPRRGGE